MDIYSQNQTKILPFIQKTDYIIGRNLLANLHKIPSLNSKKYSRFLFLTDQIVNILYGESVSASLKKTGKEIVKSVIPSGEKSKNINNIPRIIAPFFQKGFDQKSVLISLGGGVVTDIGGFLSSILFRGISSILIPTTLVGQIDASIGGKTGLDFWQDDLMYKNMLGSFYQPRLVISDVDVLKTLPEKEILNGLSEMAKYWIGWGKPNIKQLLMIKKAIKHLADGLMDSCQVKELADIISVCQQVKIDTVQKDPFDIKSLRKKLNLGHTIGHAIEGASAGKLSHGQAVAVGLAAAAKISLFKGFLKQAEYEKILNTIRKLGLPITVNIKASVRKSSMEKIKSALKLDKKGGSFVLIKHIGQIETGIFVEQNIVDKVLKETIC